MPPLPPGLTPVAAGRWGLWLLSRRSYRAAQRRRWLPSRAWPQDTLARRWVHLITPWAIPEYPGAVRALAGVLGVSVGSAHRYLKADSDIPKKHYLKVALHLDAHASQCMALAQELHALATLADKSPKPRNRVFALAGKRAIPFSGQREIGVSGNRETGET